MSEFKESEVPARYQDPATIETILRESKTIAVVGLSSDRSRPSNSVARYLQAHGYTIVGVNPSETVLLGEPCYPSLGAIPFPVDLVDVFRRSEFTPAIAEEAAQIGAKALWLQLDIINLEAGATAERGGLRVVMDRCTEVEHARLFR
ncbi:MAG: CoA-binding protein [Chloroflexota bacterium]|nr:CoA-binding protein [Chloroflexota bacterium]